MASLTSPPSSGCVDCVHMAGKISELERRISNLHQIREAEVLLDTIILGAAQPDSQETDVAAPFQTPSVVGAASRGEPGDVDHHPTAEVRPPAATAHGSWAQLGARPRIPMSSTPSQEEPWSVVGPRRGRGGRRSGAPPPDHIHLQNRFDLFSLEEFPPLGDGTRPIRSPRRAPRASPPAVHERPAGRKIRRSMPIFTPAPQKTFTRRPLHQSPAPPTPQLLHPSQGHHPDALIVGTSIIRHVRVNRCNTFCYPGALVNDISHSAHELSQQNPSVSTIIIHAGINDLKLQQSETLKMDFISLIQTIIHFLGLKLTF
ncbi:uncharacterized protein LOC121645396 isoform X2 [Melanotaenia boesemani]|uniref:uncharacterized protein LOC121636717 isoform X2 n=1 Tax=Melanotaenia boesemani TaxID=1250792 RepID=UPI001C05C171|nr:uncharacterized protein LOC121636717 isoform X2 [Melanotaenia boesemani]XP_041849752.1 uncharacterized protein LOC121645396 isoform X2 [Melanotaenia boesemani]